MPRDQFLELRCPNRHRRDKDWLVCYAEAAGPSMEMLKRFDFKGGPFYDIRFCERCHTFFTIKIFDLESPIVYSIKKGEINFIKADNVFPQSVTEGRKIK